MSDYKPEIGELVRYRRRDSADNWERCQIRARSGMQAWLKPYFSKPDNPHIYYNGQDLVVDECNLEFLPIPKCEPKSGEVWEFSDGAYLITQDVHGVSSVRLDGNQFHASDYPYEDGVKGTRVASSIQEYLKPKIAREFLKSAKKAPNYGVGHSVLVHVVERAAQLDGEG